MTAVTKATLTATISYDFCKHKNEKSRGEAKESWQLSLARPFLDKQIDGPTSDDWWIYQRTPAIAAAAIQRLPLQIGLLDSAGL